MKIKFFQSNKLGDVQDIVFVIGYLFFLLRYNLLYFPITSAYGATAIGTGLFGLICGFIGLVIFSYNRYCDPVTDGTIFSKDQVMLCD